MLMPESTGNSMICAPADCEGQGGYFGRGLMTADSQSRKRDREGFCGTSPPHKGNSLDRKPRNRIPVNCGKELTGSSLSTADGFWWESRRETLSFQGSDHPSGGFFFSLIILQ